jgi:hypothetical protein
MTTTNTLMRSAAATFSGKGKSARTTALLQVAPLAFAEEEQRAAMVANLHVVLGKSPTDAQVAVAKRETIIGYVASRLPVSELPKGKTGPADRLEHARVIVCSMAAPPKEGRKANKLRAGQVGRRTAVQHRIVRNAEQRTSQLFAELGLSGAQTVREKAKKAKKAQRAPSMAGSGKGKAGGSPLAKAQANVLSDAAVLLKPAPQVTAADYVQHMQTQLAALCAFDAKHAKKRPTTHSAFAEQLLALKQTANKAANLFAERQAKAQAEADAK